MMSALLMRKECEQIVFYNRSLERMWFSEDTVDKKLDLKVTPITLPTSARGMAAAISGVLVRKDIAVKAFRRLLLDKWLKTQSY